MLYHKNIIVIKKIFCLLLLLAAVSIMHLQSVNAQVTKVKGVVKDSTTGEVIPMASVLFVGTTIGITSDFDGEFYLETRSKVSEVLLAYVGYEKKTVKIRSGAFNQLDVKLVPNTELKEITVNPGVNPAIALMKRVYKNKDKNDISKMDGYQYSTYVKMEIDVTNMNPRFKNKKLQKNFGFIFNYMDTSAITGKAFLPVMITESKSDYYYRKRPRFEKEILKASRISGVKDNNTFSQFTGHFYVNINLYDNYVNIFEVNFVSPLNNYGNIFYNYFLVDSVMQDNRKIYKLRFHPKAYSVPVLDGQIMIDSSTCALVSARVTKPKRTDVNWLRNLVYEVDNKLCSDCVKEGYARWFPNDTKFFADFSIQPRDSSKLTSFLGHRKVHYSNIKITDKIPEDVEKQKTSVIVSKDVNSNSEEYWAKNRPYDLTKKERQIYSVVDSIKNVPLYKNIYDIINTVLFGYYKYNKLSWGPYYKIYSYNDIEGNRFQFGAKTNSEFSKKVQFRGYLAYGIKDSKFKGSTGLTYKLNTNKISRLNVDFKRDMIQLGASVNAFSEGNILSTILSKGDSRSLSLVNQLNMDWEEEWTPGFRNTMGIQMRKIYNSPYVRFLKPNGDEISAIHSTVLKLNTRWFKDEILVRNTFSEISMGSDYPMFELNLSAGFKNFLGNDYKFYRTEMSISHNFDIPPFGYSAFKLVVGKIFGKVPYPLLKLHEGNATYFYDPYAFSCMDFYEFASDTWISLFWEHHFKGFLLGKIPLMKRLKWRSVATFKGLIGKLDDKNNGSLENTNAYLEFPEGMKSVSKPYFETGVGIENIFKIIRVDGVWRLSHRNDNKDVSNFALNISIHLSF